jgi:predicted HTH transcriptional regulator
LTFATATSTRNPERPHAGSVRKHVCAFANALGGFYIIGATRERAREPWKIDPVDFGGEEPGT